MKHFSYADLEQALEGNDTGQLKKAREKCRALILSKPRDAAFLHLMGIIERRLGHLDLALKWIKKGLSIRPDSAELHGNCGEILTTQKKYSEAMTAFERSIALQPDYAKGYYGLGTVFMECGDDPAAMKAYNDALAIDPNYPDVLNNLGVIRYRQGAFNDSILLYEKALSVYPEYPDALNNLGNALKDTGKLPEAIAAYEHAISLKGDDPDYRLNLAMARLASGQFEAGWREYEWRWKATQLLGVQRQTAKPLWQGEPAEGRVVLIRAEQGFGDTLQFCRYAPLVAARGMRVVMEVQPALVKLLESLDGVEKIIAHGEALPDFDLHCPMMSLPGAIHTTLETIPPGIPYLSVNEECFKLWRSLLRESATGRLKVGLAWAGSPRFNSPDLIAVDRRRSIAPELLAPLMGIAGVQFYSLQKGGSPAPREFGLIDLMDKCGDFADTAALVANMDLIVTVDTAMAHLAGALGKPTWLLNRSDSCWRWLRNRDDSPWYPTMRLFRQPSPGDWESVVSSVGNALPKFIANSQAPCLSPGENSAL